MSARQSRKARAIAHAEATRRGLWTILSGHVLGKWYRRLIARLSKRYRAKCDDRTGRLYKLNLKRWSHETYAAMHDPDLAEMERVRRKLEKKRAREQLARAAKAKQIAAQEGR